MLLQHLSPTEIIFYAFVIANVLTEEVTLMVRRIILHISYKYNWARYKEFSRHNKLRPLVMKKRKPWDCMKCMTGWCALVLALLAGYNWESIVWCCAGLTVGALYEQIKMRWL